MHLLVDRKKQQFKNSVGKLLWLDLQWDSSLVLHLGCGSTVSLVAWKAHFESTERHLLPQNVCNRWCAAQLGWPGASAGTNVTGIGEAQLEWMTWEEWRSVAPAAEADVELSGKAASPSLVGCARAHGLCSALSPARVGLNWVWSEGVNNTRSLPQLGKVGAWKDRRTPGQVQFGICAVSEETLHACLKRDILSLITQSKV